MSEFFLELFSEEIPARMQSDAAKHIRDFMTDALIKNKLGFDEVFSFVASRRLGICIKGLPEAQADLVEERKGPSVTAAQQALDGFLRSVSMTKDQLQIRKTPKGDFYFASISRKGRSTADVLQETVEALLHSFPWPKSMRWAGHKEYWVRPLHAIVCLFDGNVIPVEFAGVKSGKTTYGHRFLAPQAVEVDCFADYQEKMRKAFVLIDPQERKKIICERARELAQEAGYRLLEDEAFLQMRQDVLAKLQRIQNTSLAEVLLWAKEWEIYQNDFRFLDVIALWYRDLLFAKRLHDDTLLIQQDLQAALYAHATEDAAVLAHKAIAVQQARTRLTQNANFRLTIEVLLMELKGE